MSEELFRKKVLDQAKSPDELNDYIQVANKGIWLLLISIIALLVGALAWGIFGKVESKLSVLVQVEQGNANIILVDTEIETVDLGMTVKFADTEATIIDIRPVIDHVFSGVLECNAVVPDGVYDGWVVRGTVKPISFILN